MDNLTPDQVQPQSAINPDKKEKESLARSNTTIIYVLMAFGVFAFLPWIAAAILIYVKRDDMAGTIYESHATWCLRTFWYSILWEGLAFVIAVGTFGIGLTVVWPVFFAVHIWVLYRTIKGAVRLGEKRAV